MFRNTRRTRLIHEKCEEEPCNCLRLSMSWFAGVAMEDVIFDSYYVTNELFRAVRCKVNEGLKDFLQSKASESFYVMTGKEYRMDTLQRKLGFNGPVEAIDRIAHVLWVFEADLFREHYVNRARLYARTNLINLILRRIGPVCTDDGVAVNFNETLPYYFSRSDPFKVIEWWPNHGNDWKLPEKWDEYNYCQEDFFIAFDAALRRVRLNVDLPQFSGELELAWLLHSQHRFSNRALSMRAAGMIWPYLSALRQSQLTTAALVREENHLANLVYEELKEEMKDHRCGLHWEPPEWGKRFHTTLTDVNE